MEISFSISNNICINDSNGSVVIESINFEDSNEAFLYRNYIIVWSGNFDENTFISTDGFIVENLKNGLYQFSLFSPDSQQQSQIYNVEITSQSSEIIIKNLKYLDYSCNESAYIYIEVDGGVPPYNFIAGNTNLISNDNKAKIENLSNGLYEVSVRDSNGCTVIYDKILEIKDHTFSNIINNVLPPQLHNSYGLLDISLIGEGPFSFLFVDQLEPEKKIYIDTFETKYIKSVDTENSIYNYFFDDLITPGIYTLTIRNSSGCSNFIDFLNIPNSLPIEVSINLSNSGSFSVPNYSEPLPIFDTLLIPYKFIVNNSELWTYIKNKNIKDNIDLFINNEKYETLITRNILDKECLDQGDIEILRLGNDPEDWFFYLYISPGININSEPDLLSAKINIKTKNEIFDITLGLDQNQLIDTNNPSIIIGSFILDDLGYPEYHNGGEVNVSLLPPLSFEDKNFNIKNITKLTSLNTYSVGFVTILNFLEQFDVLISRININSISACNLSNEKYQYILNIKNLLKAINSFNNLNSIFIYNPLDIVYQGSISLGISGNNFFTLFNNEIIQNNYSIEYYYIKNNSNLLYNIYIGSKIVENVNTVNNLPEGFYIIKIKDLYKNIVRTINFQNNFIDYDDHFIKSKKMIQKFNSNLLSSFNYGDILIYIGQEFSSVGDNIIEQAINDLPDFSSPEQPDNVARFDIITQTKNNIDASSISVELLDQEIECQIHGPKNYKKTFNKNTSFTNLIPGVYTILGDEESLRRSSKYQNEIRIFLDKNTDKFVFLSFVSYSDFISIKSIDTKE
jgi:hypothetical protein